MTMVKDINGNPIDYEAAVILMNEDIAEELHMLIAPCTEQEFIEEYAELHEEQFGEKFAPYCGGQW